MPSSAGAVLVLLVTAHAGRPLHYPTHATPNHMDVSFSASSHYSRLTSSLSHKLYIGILVLYTLSLLTIHGLSIASSNAALRLSTLISLSVNSSVVPTFASQDGQSILRLCNPGQSNADCQVVTSVAPMITPTPTNVPEQLGSGGNGGTTSVPVNPAAGNRPQTTAQQANAQTTVVSNAVRPAGGTVTAPTGAKASASSTSDVSPTTSKTGAPADGGAGLLIAAPPQPTSTDSATTSTTSSGLVIADTPLTTAGADDGKDATRTRTALTLPTLITLLNPGTTTADAGTSTEDISTSTSEDETATETETSSLESSTTTEDSQSTSTSSTESSTTTESTSSSSTTKTSSRSTSTSTSFTSTATSTKSATSRKDASVVEISLPTSITTRALPSFVRPEFASTSTSTSSGETPSSSAPRSSESASAAPSDSTVSESSTSAEPAVSTSTKEKEDRATSTKEKEDRTTSTKKQEEETRSVASSSTETASSSESSATEPKETLAAQLRGRAGPRLARRYSGLYASSGLHARAFSVVPVNDTTGSLTGVDVTDIGNTGSNAVTRLDVLCVLATAFPREQLRQALMEDIVVLGYYLWFAGVGVAAIVNESIPHLVTVFLASVLGLCWSASQLVRTRALAEQFDAFVTRGACKGIDILPNYPPTRKRLELQILVINAIGTVALGIIAFRLLKKYRAKKTSSTVNRYLFKVMLVLRVAILLGGFFLLGMTVLWVQQLFNSPSAVPSTATSLLKAGGLLSVLLSVPWGVTGWWALRAEETHGKASRILMGVFVGITIFILAGLTVTFASDVYREVFSRWAFFGVMGVSGFFVLVGSFGTGIVCWMRFKKAFPVYFETEKPRTGSENGHSRGGSGANGASGSFHGGVEEIIPETIRWDYSNTAEKAWEPFSEANFRQSQFTSSDRQSTAFSYGLRSPAPPMPTRFTGSSSHLSVATAL